MFNNQNCAGSKKTNDPRLVEEIVKDFLANSDSPFAVAYRKRMACQTAKQRTAAGPEVYHPNTMLCIDVKTLLRHDRHLQPGKNYDGMLCLKEMADEYRCDELVVFTERAPQYVKRNPRMFDGKYITITLREDGSFCPNLKPVEIGDGFDIIGYASEVGNELLWALSSLLRE